MTSSRLSRLSRTLALALAALVCVGTHAAHADLLVSSVLNHDTVGQVLRYDDQTGAFLGVLIDNFSGGPGGVYRGMVIGPDGNLYVAKTISTVGQPGKVQRHDVATGAFLDDFVTLDSGGLTRPKALGFAPDGDLYVTSKVPAGADDDSILRYDGTSGAFAGVVVPPTGNPSTGETFNDFTFGADGSIYVAASAGNVLRYNASTGAFLDLFAGGSGGTFTGLTFGPDGNLYVSDALFGNSVIRRFNGTTGALIDDFVSPGSGGLMNPSALLFGPDGHLYVTNTETNSVKRYDGRTGAFLGDFVTPGSGGLENPAALLFTPAPTPVVPEPGTLALVAAGLALIARGSRPKTASVRAR